jgi:hypothetical protein
MRRSSLLVLSALLLLPAGCADPETFMPDASTLGPAGVIDGTVTYAGPLPCTENGFIVGGAVLLLFDVRLLPPPEGLGTTAESISVVSGESLFAGVRGRLTFNKDGSRWCPSDDTPHVTVSGTWIASPLEGGTYQVRGFYDLDGDFDPLFSIANLPTKGDIGGGAIDNAADVLLGAAPVFRRITLGVEQNDGTFRIPGTGARIGGVTVTLALPLALERPVFYAKEILDENGTNDDPNNVVIASDFQFEVFTAGDPLGTETSLVRYVLAGGVPREEENLAQKSPFLMPVKDAAPCDPATSDATRCPIAYSRQDVNGDGQIGAEDHVPESALVPALYPLSIFSKLADEGIVNQSTPAVVIQGLTLYKSLFPDTVTIPLEFSDVQPEVVVGVRPSALCIDPTDTSKNGVLVISHDKDKEGNVLIADEGELKKALAAQFGRPIDITYGCLPQGRYALNLVYPTGQAWTVPNDAGVCALLEKPSKDGSKCGTRPRLASQSVVLTVGPPDNAAYCRDNPTPAACSPPKQP